MSEENVIPKEWIFKGIRVSKGKRVYAWGTIGSDSHGLYDKPLVAASVGGIYQFYETADGGSFKVSGKYAPHFLRRHDNLEDVKIWAAEEEAAKQHLARKSLNTKAAKVEPLEDIFAGLRAIIPKLNRTERRALFARIADEVFGGQA